MTAPGSCAYVGEVFHQRLAPKKHAFAYRVFALCLDVDGIDALAARSRLFSRNRFNLLSFHDADFGDGGAEPAAARARGVLREAGLSGCGERIFLLCYPRILGFAFNPLSVYFCYGAEGRLGAVIYEVSNTFSERKSYVIPVEGDDGAIRQFCAKEMYVSPFTPARGRYDFRVRAPGDRVFVGVNLISDGGALLTTHFRGERRALDDRAILRLLLRHPLMTVKVVAGIHFEAARLWLKGVPLVRRHASPRFSISIVASSARDVPHAE